MHRWPAMEVLGRAAAAHLGEPLTNLDYVEVYSCFPAAVRVQQRALGLPVDGVPTITGGEPFAGGPWNNFVLQATVAMVELLRAHPGARGMVTTVSGFLNKPGLAVFSTEPAANGLLVADLRVDAEAATSTAPMLDEHHGPATIVACTVVSERSGDRRTVVIAETASGERCVAASGDAGRRRSGRHRGRHRDLDHRRRPRLPLLRTHETTGRNHDMSDEAMADEPSLLFERQGPTVVLTMNRPARRNALSLDMIVRLADAWEAIDADDSIRSVILTGAEGAYCVGGDLDAGWMAGNRSAEPSENERRAMDDMSIIGRGLLLTDWLRTPIIAVVNGDCMGGGCEMLQQTDIRIAEEQARFGVPEARRGLIAGAGSTMRLKRQIPYAVALEMLITGRILDAEEALRWGLVTHVVPAGEGLAEGPRDRRHHRRQRPAVGCGVQGVRDRDRLVAGGRGPQDRGRIQRDGHAQQRRQGGHEGLHGEARAKLHGHLNIVGARPASRTTTRGGGCAPPE